MSEPVLPEPVESDDSDPKPEDRPYAYEDPKAAQLPPDKRPY